MFESDGHIFRALSDQTYDDFSSLIRSGLLDELMEAGLVVPTQLVDPTELGATLPPGYDGAQTVLTLNRKLLERDFVLKDANPYYVMHWNGRIVLTDVLSIAPYRGGAWQAYGQFADSFLMPLFLEAYRGLHIQAPHNTVKLHIKLAHPTHLADCYP